MTRASLTLFACLAACTEPDMPTFHAQQRPPSSTTLQTATFALG